MINIPILSSVIPSVNDNLGSEGEGVEEKNSSFLKILQDINTEQVKNISQFMKKATKDTGCNLQRYCLDNKEGEETGFSIKGMEDQKILDFLKEVFSLKSGLKEMTGLMDEIFNDSKGFLGENQNLGAQDLIDLKGIQEDLKRLLIKEYFVPEENRGGETQEVIEKTLQGLKIMDENTEQEVTNSIEKKEGLSLKDLLIKIGVLSDKEKTDISLKEFFNQKDSISYKENLVKLEEPSLVNKSTELIEKDSISYKENLVKLEEPSLVNKSTELIEGALDGNKQILEKGFLNTGNINFEQNLDMDKKPIQAFQLFADRLDTDPKVISSLSEIVSKRIAAEFENEIQKNGLSLISELEIKSERIGPMESHHRDMDTGLLHKESSWGETKGTIGRFANGEIIDRFLSDNQIIDQIIDKVNKPIFKNGKNEIKLSLKPEFLGELKMEISVEKNVFKANVTVENYFIKEVLDGNIEKLRQALQTLGIEVREFSVSVGQDHDKQATNHNGSNNSKALFGLPKEKLEEERSNTPSNMITQRGLIDILI